jgi:hypothetical protein
MIEEGRRRAAAAGIDNLSFVAGGSDDLAALSPDLGQFAAVTISQAFHRMADVPAGPNPAGRHDPFPAILTRLGERRDAFEADVRAALGHQDTSPLTVRLVNSALLGHSPFT